MSKIGVTTSRKTKFNSTTNNPFQGPTAISLTGERGPLFTCFIDPFDPTSTQVRNATVPFNIRRLKPSEPGGPGASYGDNRSLYLGIARAQDWEFRTPITLNIGVNNNGLLSETDGVTLLRLNSTLAGKEVPCFGSDEGQAPFAEGLFTKEGAEGLGITLTNGNNFKFSLQQAVAITSGEPVENARGNFFIPDSIMEFLQNPGDEVELTIAISMSYVSASTGGVEVPLEECNLILRLYYSL